jgi:hypothetical protein
MVNCWVKLFRSALQAPPREEYEILTHWFTMYDCHLIQTAYKMLLVLLIEADSCCHSPVSTSAQCFLPEEGG